MMQLVPSQAQSSKDENNNNNQQQPKEQQQQGLNNIFQWSMQYSDPKVLEQMKKQQEDPKSVQNPKSLPAPMSEHQIDVFYQALNEALRLQTSLFFQISFFF